MKDFSTENWIPNFQSGTKTNGTKRCPICGEDISQILKEAAEKNIHKIFCNFMKKTQEMETRTYYQHSLKNPIRTAEGCIRKEMISTYYIDDVGKGNVRFVSVVGSSTSGKTLFLRALGMGLQYSGVFENTLSPHLPARVNSSTAALDDDLSAQLQSMVRGVLSPRTSMDEVPIYLPVRISCSESLQNMRSVDKGGFFNLLKKKIQRVDKQYPWWTIVFKDYPGELVNAGDENNGLDADNPRRRHFFSSEWFILFINCSSDEKLRASVEDVYGWLYNGIQPNLMDRLKKLRLIVVLSCVDERVNALNDPLIKAMSRTPNRFPMPKDIDPEKWLKDYVENMREVSFAARSLIIQNGQAVNMIRELEDNFCSVSYCAISSLGVAPCDISGKERDGNPYTGKRCICVPGLVRIMDPLLMILHTEGALNLLRS